LRELGDKSSHQFLANGKRPGIRPGVSIT